MTTPPTKTGRLAWTPPTAGLGFLAIVLLVLRLVEGAIWFGGGVSKPPPDFNWFPEWLQKESEYAWLPAYKWFLDTIVIPNLTFFGWMQFLTELFLGIMLLTGTLSGLTGALAGLWAANIVVGSYAVPGEVATYLWLFALAPWIIAAARPGRVLGVDVWLRPKLLANKRPWVRKFAEWAT